jgi:hypothetical protein
VHLRRHARTVFTLGVTFVIAFGGSVSASAEENSLQSAGLMSSRQARPIFESAPLAAAAQVSTATTAPTSHQFGVGVRLHGESPTWVGGSVRYFFYGGPLGVQGEVLRSGLDLGTFDFSAIRFAPSVLYRFREYQFEAPLSLTPYAGIGLSFVHSRFDDDHPLAPFLDDDDTSVGILLYGGVELFFERVPNLGVSGEITYSSNDDVTGGGFGTAIGGAAFTAAAHWYFW